MGVAVLSGGVGAARMLAGIVQVVPPASVTALVNVGDDETLHGLRISPDLDTITYTLAGAIDRERGWGLGDETWQAMDVAPALHVVGRPRRPGLVQPRRPRPRHAPVPHVAPGRGGDPR